MSLPKPIKEKIRTAAKLFSGITGELWYDAAEFGYDLAAAEIEQLKTERDCYHKQLMKAEDKIADLRKVGNAGHVTIEAMHE